MHWQDSRLSQSQLTMDEEEYAHLRDDFNREKLRVADLRRILTAHDIDYDVHAKKADLRTVFDNQVWSRRAQLRAEILGVRPSATQIESAEVVVGELQSPQKSSPRRLRQSRPKPKRDAVVLDSVDFSVGPRTRSRSRSPVRSELRGSDSPRRRRAEIKDEIKEEEATPPKELKSPTKRGRKPKVADLKEELDLEIPNLKADEAAEEVKGEPELDKGSSSKASKSKEDRQAKLKVESAKAQKLKSPKKRSPTKTTKAKAAKATKESTKDADSSKEAESSFSQDNVFQSGEIDTPNSLKRKRLEVSERNTRSRREHAPQKHQHSAPQSLPENAAQVFDHAPDLQPPANVSQEPFDISVGESEPFLEAVLARIPGDAGDIEREVILEHEFPEGTPSKITSSTPLQSSNVSMQASPPSLGSFVPEQARTGGFFLPNLETLGRVGERLSSTGTHLGRAAEQFAREIDINLSGTPSVSGQESSSTDQSAEPESESESNSDSSSSSEEEAGESLTTRIKSFGHSISDGASNLFGKINQGADSVRDRVETSAESVKLKLRNGTDSVKEKLGHGAESVKERLETSAASVKDVAASQAPTVKSFAAKALELLKLILKVTLYTLVGSLVGLGVVSVISYGVWWRTEKLHQGWCADEWAPPSIRIPRWLDGKPSHEWLQAPRNHVVNFLEATAPSCTECPENAICGPDFVSCYDTYMLKSHPLSLGGLIPLAPKCVPDLEQRREIDRLVYRAVNFLRERRAQFECGTDGVSTPEVSYDELATKLGGGESVLDQVILELANGERYTDVEVVAAHRQVPSNIHGSNANFQDTDSIVYPSYSSSVFVSHSRAYMSLWCRLRLAFLGALKRWAEKYAVYLKWLSVSSILLSCAGLVVYLQIKSRAAFNQDIDHIVEILKNVRKEADNDPTGQTKSYVSTYVLRNEVKPAHKARFEDALKRHARIRTRHIEEDGEIIRIWEWAP